ANLVLHHNGYQEIYDGDEMIAEIYYLSGHLSVEIHTEKTVNITTAIQADSCAIHASGQVNIDAELLLNSYLEVSAESLCLFQATNATDINLTIKKDLIIAAPVKTDGLQIDAGSVVQNAGAKTVANHLRLIADECEIVGDFKASKQSSITINTFKLGADAEQTTIELSGDNCLHIGNCSVQGDTQLLINQTDAHAEGELFIYGDMDISGLALVELENVNFDASNVKNDATLRAKDGIVKIDVLS
ncbi:MAG: hypothetical protein M3R00_08785, partial [Pseudomonadota bacterium]|nr:hypothetical protein [Pseudomonadota bacterium]